ncbi:hypothetical protein YPPY71_1111, partial [Yersinia pestis PY-71]
MEHDCLL